jgi:hypothetical protein
MPELIVTINARSGNAVPLEAERNKFETGTARIPHNLSDGNVPLRVAGVEAKEKTQTSRKRRCPLAFDKSPVRLLEVREGQYRLAKQFGGCVSKVSVVNVSTKRLEIVINHQISAFDCQIRMGVHVDLARLPL